MRAFYRVLYFIVLSCFTLSSVFSGTTGKIVGTITDATSGDKLPSVNVVVEGTMLGAVTNQDGYFVILNVPPGRHRLKASLLGYTPSVAANVRIDIDQTTTQNFTISEEAITAEEVMVVAQRPVIQKDVAASRANIEIADVEKLPVVSVAGAVQLQAGVQGGLVIRGGTIDQTVFVMDGLTLRDERTNNPFTAVSLSSVADIQVQTGGFNAEYGNLRSGVVNVVTKEGNRSGYSVNFIGRLSPAQPKHFGPSIYDRNSYYIRPFVDPAVCWTGTDNGAWDDWTRAQYQPFIGGWKAISAASLRDADPTRHLTPEAAQQLFLFEHRKVAEITKPDWDVDAGFGGPFPFISDALGNLRFFTSYRQSQSMYLIPLSRDGFRDWTGQVKLTSDISSQMKVTGSFLLGRSWGTNDNNAGNPGIFTTARSIAEVMSQVSYIDTRIFATDYWAPTSTWYTMGGLKLSHVVNPTTFYDASVTVFRSKYETNPGALRNTSKVYQFGNYSIDMSPFGFSGNPLPPSSPVSTLRYGLGFSNSRDSSIVATYTAKLDVTSQVDKYNQLKAGIEAAYTDNYASYAQYDEGLPRSNTRSSWHTFPIRGGIYAQDKLEFEGMVANLGLRLDYLDPNGEWYRVTDPYSFAFTGSGASSMETVLTKQKTKRIFTLSPRVGIAFPISDNSKLFFNYGHFRQVPQPDNLFLVRRSAFDNSVTRFADPGAPFPKTVAYELGYEHSLFDEYLVRVAAYYKDITNENYLATYISQNSSVNYTLSTNNRYRDIRGVELTLARNRGDWVQGFVNYTYDVRTTGYFGFPRYYQSQQDQDAYITANWASLYQSKPLPQPYARANVDFYTPSDFGPDLGGLKLLADWRVNFIGSWQSGQYITWIGGGSRPDILYNFQWTDYWNVDMRISKAFQVGRMNIQLFADLSNLFNTRMMSPDYGFVDAPDYNSYMKSLHLPSDREKDLGYVNVAGDDRPGMFRKDGVDFQPIVAVTQYAELSSPGNQQARPFYYVKENNAYYQLVNGSWQQVDAGRLQKVLDDKAYIDMPNLEAFTFLNPRRIFWGVRLGFDL